MTIEIYYRQNIDNAEICAIFQPTQHSPTLHLLQIFLAHIHSKYILYTIIFKLYLEWLLFKFFESLLKLRKSLFITNIWKCQSKYILLLESISISKIKIETSGFPRYRDQKYDCKDLQKKVKSRKQLQKLALLCFTKEWELIPFYDPQTCALKW